MFRKITRKLAIVLVLSLLMTMGAAAANLTIDTNHPQFGATRWQTSNPPGAYALVNEYAVVYGPTRAGSNMIPGADVQRWGASVNPSEINNHNDAGTDTMDGASVVHFIIPFAETVNLDTVSFRTNDGNRRHFLRAFTSTDGTNWTEIGFSQNADLVNLDSSYNPLGGTDGPAVDNVWATIAVGQPDDVNLLTMTFAQSDATSGVNFLRLTGFGNDGASGTNVPSNPWFTFNSLSVTGSVAAAEAPPAPPVVETPPAVVETETPAPAADPAPAPAPTPPPPTPATTATTPSPRTNDALFLAIALTVLAAAGFVFIKRRKNNA